MSRVYVVTDLGWGDAGKGTTTHWLCCKSGARTVVRTGGPQAFHTVATADGRVCTHSQFGSGTLVGARTHLSKHMVIAPYSLLAEGRVLRDEHGITDIFERITLHRDALVIAPFQTAANRLRELVRGQNRYGTVGMGVGEAVLDSEVIGDLAIRVRDFNTPGLAEKLEEIRQLKLHQLGDLIERIDELPDQAQRELEILLNPEIVGWATDEFGYLGRVVEIVDDDFLGDLLRQTETVVFEPSQGVLLDRWIGFHPYTTKLNSTSSDALGLLSQYGFSRERVTRLAITRVYQTRHGAGPFPTEDPWLTRELPDEFNGEHEWQGSFRVGHLDAVVLRYAIASCGGPEAFDGLVVTCLDRVARKPWRICNGYRTGIWPADLDQFFVREEAHISDLLVRPNTQDDAHLRHQKRLGQLIGFARPRYTNLHDPSGEQVVWTIEERLGIPVVVASYGPREDQKQEVRPI